MTIMFFLKPAWDSEPPGALPGYGRDLWKDDQNSPGDIYELKKKKKKKLQEEESLLIVFLRLLDDE